MEYMYELRVNGRIVEQAQNPRWVKKIAREGEYKLEECEIYRMGKLDQKQTKMLRG